MTILPAASATRSRTTSWAQSSPTAPMAMPADRRHGRSRAQRHPASRSVPAPRSHQLLASAEPRPVGAGSDVQPTERQPSSATPPTTESGQRSSWACWGAQQARRKTHCSLRPVERGGPVRGNSPVFLQRPSPRARELLTPTVVLQSTRPVERLMRQDVPRWWLTSAR